MREGERLRCEVRGNPPPSVTWYRNGEAVVLPARSSREHAGKYMALARGALELKNFTVEVEVLVLGGHGGSGSCCRSSEAELTPPSPLLFPGSANSCGGYFLLAAALGHVVLWM